ncbi:hypothetical protein Gogos_018159 [Gossypium gossypioides]|uniref:Uncharacterized protein n=2 Tax=Gossypium TaxID=3633 RepID=A0A7J9BD94_GOSGO|nr:hypothetical protein [Gossypium gossypioides]
MARWGLSPYLLPSISPMGRGRPREGMRLNNRVKYGAKISKRRRKRWLINGVSKKWWTTIHCFSVNFTCVCAFGSV